MLPHNILQLAGWPPLKVFDIKRASIDSLPTEAADVALDIARIYDPRTRKQIPEAVRVLLKNIPIIWSVEPTDLITFAKRAARKLGGSGDHRRAEVSDSQGFTIHLIASTSLPTAALYAGLAWQAIISALTCIVLGNARNFLAKIFVPPVYGANSI